MDLGIRKGDVLTKVDGKDIGGTNDFFNITSTKEDYSITLERGKNKITYEIDRESLDEKIGIYMEPNEKLVSKTYSFVDSFKNTVREVFVQTRVTVYLFVEMIGGLLTKGELSKDIAGPVGIAKLTYNFTEQGIGALVLFTAMLSMSLAVINIMPFPALDGGRLLFMVIEGIFRRKVSEKIEGYIHTVGFVLLMALILIVTWNDIVRIFS